MPTLSLTEGSGSRPITSTTALTPAELVALFQVVRIGKQSLVLDLGGNAIGGSMALSSRMSQNIASLVIPKGVTVVDNFAKTLNLNLTGNLTNSGTFLAVSSNPLFTTAYIGANNILNEPGGVLSSSLPAGGLPGFTSPATSLNLVLNAAQDITNGGTITSSGNLTATAGGSIINAPPTNSTGSSPLMQASGNIALVSGAGNIVNHGLISSSNGDISVQTQTAQNLVINNVSGTLQALNGAINIRDASYSGKADNSITGGDFVSKELNLNSGTGNLTADVDSIAGTVNITAGTAHTTVNNGQLLLGDLKLTGDPTFYNDNGPIVIAGNISVGEDLAIVASGDVTSSGDYSITANDGTRGYDITIVAGANITASETASPTVGPGTGTTATWSGTGTPANNTVTINGPSSTGGSINFAGQNMTISSAAVSGSSPGGNVRLIAYADSVNGTNGGQVLLSSGSSINTGGTGSGNNGNVTIIAGAATGTAVSTGSITTTGGTGSGGLLTIANTQPSFTSGSSLSFYQGSITSGNDFSPSSNAPAGSVLVNGNVTSSGNQQIITPTLVLSNGSILSATSTSNIQITAPNGSDLTVVAPSGGQATISTNGGSINIGSTNAGSPGIDTINFVNSSTTGGTLNFTGGPVNIYPYVPFNGNTHTLNIGNSFNLCSDNDITFYWGNEPGLVNNNGSISTSGAGATIFFGAVPILMTGTSGTVSATNSGHIFIEGGNITFNSNYTFNTGAGGYVTLLAGNITLASGVIVTSQGGQNGALFQIDGGALILGNGSAIASSNATGTAFQINVGAISSTGTATIQSSGGTIAIDGGFVPLSFVSTDSNPTTLQAFGGPLGIGDTGGPITVNSQVTIQSDNNITLNVAGISIINNGLVTTSAANGTIFLAKYFSLSGSGSYTATGSGFPLIQMYSFTNNGNELNGSLTMNAGPNGTVFSTGTLLSIDPNSTFTVGGGSTFLVDAQTLALGNNASLVIQKNSGQALTFLNSGGYYPVQNLDGPSGGTATITTSGGSIALGNLSDGNPFNVISAGSGLTLLHLNGGPVSISSVRQVTLDANTQLTSNNSITILSSNGGPLQSTIASNGSISATQLSLTADGVVSVNNLSATNGSVSVVAGTGTLYVQPSAQLTATEGNITLQNNDTGAGAILIDSNSQITATTAGSVVGNVYIVIGQLPSSGASGTAPANVNVATSGNGQVFFGPNSINASTPTNYVNANGQTVLFNSTNPSTTITLNGGVTINSGLSTVFSSLDFTNLAVFNQAVALQAHNLIGGNLTGLGTVVLAPSNLARTLSAEDIPSNISLTLSGFGSSNPVNIALTAASTTSQVIIAGSHQFTGSGISGVLNITSTQPGPVLSVTGQLGSQGDLSVSAPSAQNSGHITSQGNLTVTTGSLQNTGTLQAAGNLSVTSTNNLTISGTNGTFTGTNVSFTAPGSVSFLNATQNVNGPLSIAASGVLLDAQSTLSSTGNITINTGQIEVDGTLYASSRSSQILVQGISSLNVLGNNGFILDDGLISFSVSGANALNVNSSIIFYPSSNGRVLFAAPDAGGSVNFGAGTNNNDGAPGSVLEISSSSVNLGATASILSAGNIVIDAAISGGLLTVTLPDSSFATLSAQFGNSVTINGSPGQPVSFIKSPGTGTTSLNVQGPLNVNATNSTVFVDTPVTLNVQSYFTNLTMTLNNSSLMLSGTLMASAQAQQIFIQSTAGDLTLEGNGSIINNLTGAAGQIQVYPAGNAYLNNSYTYNAGPNGAVAFIVPSTNGAIVAGANSNQNVVSGTLDISTPTLLLGNNAVFQSASASGTAIYISAPQNLSLNIALSSTVAASPTSTFLTGGGAISINAPFFQSITFGLAGNAVGGTINFKGGPLQTSTFEGTTTVSGNMSLVSDNNISMSSSLIGTLNNNGTITTTQPGGNINISSTGEMIISGTGYILANAGGASSISISAPAPNILALNGSQVVNAGSGGSVTLQGGGIFLNPSVSVTVTGSSLTLNVYYLSMGAGSLIQSVTAGAPINITNSVGGMTITAPDNNSATISTNGGSISVLPPCCTGIQFSNSDGAGATGTAVLNLNTGGTGTITTTTTNTYGNGNTVVGPNFTLAANAQSLNMTVNIGSLTNNGSITNTGTVQVSSNGSLTVAGTGTINAAGVLINSAGPLTVGQTTISTTNGSVALTASTGALTISPSTTIQATEGNITLQNNDTSLGSIFIDSNVQISATTTGNVLGNVYIVIGPVPSTGTPNSTPSNVAVSTFGNGQVFFGPNSIVANAPTNNINANGQTVLFNTTNPSTTITLNGGVTINSGSPVSSVFTSLDFTNSAIYNQAVILQAHNLIGGNITQSGTVVLAPSNLALTLTAEDIPSNISLTLSGFGSSTPVNIALTGASTTKQVIISGTNQFTGTSLSGAVMSITSNQTGPVLVVSANGKLTSDSSLSITTDSVRNAGMIQATSALSVSGLNNLSITGTGTMSGATVSLSAPNTLSFTDANQTFTGPGTWTATNVSVDLTSFLVYNSTVNVLTSVLNNSGTIYGNAGAFLVTGMGNLTVLGNGSILAPSTIVSLSVTGAHSINFDSSPTLEALNSGSVLVNASDAGGSINVASNSSINTGGALLRLSTTSLNLGAHSFIFANGSFQIDAGGKPNNLTIVLPDSSFATLYNSFPNALNITGTTGQSVSFVKSAGSGQTTLVTDEPLNVTSTNAPISVASAVTLGSNQNLTIEPDNGTLMLNGTLSVSGTQNSQIYVQSASGTLTLSGNGSMQCNTSASGQIQVIAYAGNLDFASNYTYHVGSGVVILSTSTTAGTMTFESGSSQTVQASQLGVGTCSMILGTGTLLSVSNSGALTLFDNLNTLNVTLPHSGSATFSTNGGQISFGSPTGQYGIAFLTPNGSSGSTLNLNGGPVTLASLNGNLTISSGATVASNNNISINIGGPFGNTITNNGTVQAATSILINGGSIDCCVTVTGTNGTFATTSANGLISITANQLSVNGTLTLNAGNGASSQIQIYNGGIVTFGDGTGSTLTLNSNTAILQADVISLTNNATVRTATAPNLYVHAFYLSNNGTLSSSVNGGRIQVDDSTFGTGLNLISGSTGLITFDGGASGSIVITDLNSHYVNLESSTVFNAGANGTVLFDASSVTIAANTSQSVTAGGGSTSLTNDVNALTIITSSLTLGNNSVVSNSTYFNTGSTPLQVPAGGAGTESISNPGIVILNTYGSPMTITGAGSGGSATISTTGNILVKSADLFTNTPNIQPLSFAINPTTGGGTLNFNTSATGQATIMGQNISIASGLSFASTGSIQQLVTGGTFTNNGSVISSAFNGSIAITSPNELTIAGNGTSFLTGGGTGTITVAAGPGTALTFEGSQKFSPGSNGTVSFSATAPGQILVTNNSTETIIGTNVPVVITSPTVTINNGSAIISGSSISFGSGSAIAPLTISNNGLISSASTVSETNTQNIVVSGSGQISAAVFDATSTAGSVSINQGLVTAGSAAITSSNGGSVTLGGIFVALGALDINSASNIYINGTVLYGSDSLVTPAGGQVVVGSNGYLSTRFLSSLDLTNSTVTALVQHLQLAGLAGGSLTVNSSGAATAGNAIITPGDLAQTLSAEVVPANVSLTMSNFGSSNPINISLTNSSTSSQVIINGIESFSSTGGGSNGVISITGNGSGPLLSVSSTGQLSSDGGLSVTASGAMSLNGVVTASNLSLVNTANRSNITVGGSLTGSATLSLSLVGSSTLVQTGGLISGASVSLVAASGDLGSASSNLLTNAGTLTASTSGNAYVTSSQSLTLGTSSVGSVFQVSSSSNLSVSGNVNAGTLTLQTTASNGNISIGGNLSASSSVSLSANGSGNINQTAGLINSAVVNLISGSGNIGSNSAFINLAPTTLTVTTGGSGSVFVSDSGATTLNSSSSGGSFTLVTGGSLTVNNLSTAQGSISLVANTGTIEVRTKSSIFANEGNLLIQNNDQSHGSIVLDKKVSLEGYTAGNPALGNVTIVVGPVPSNPVAGSVPSRVTVNASNGGMAFFGTNGISASPPNNTINAIGRNVIFSTGSASASAISLSGNDVITADPPFPSTLTPPSLTKVILPVTPDSTSVPGTWGVIQPNVWLLAPSAITPVDTQVQRPTARDKWLERERNSEESDPTFLPVSFLSPAAPSAMNDRIQTSRSAIGVIMHNSAYVPALTEEGVLQIHDGDTLISAAQQTRLQVGHALISLKAGSSILIKKQGDALSVRNIYERGAHSVQLSIGETFNLAVAAGQEVVVSSDDSSLQHLLNSEPLARRGTQSVSLPNGYTVIRSEFSLVSLLKNTEVLRHLRASSNETDRSMARQIIKMAACLQQVTSTHGAYSAGGR